MHWGLSKLFNDLDRGGRFRLLDIGTGAGDLPIAANVWAGRRGFDFDLVGLERIPAAARLANEAGIPIVIGCAGALPIATASVDVVLVSQVAHHLDSESVTALFAACTRVARRGVVVADLRNSRLATHAFRIGGRLLGMHQTSIDDGVTSIARGYSAETLGTLARQATHHRVHVANRPIARVVAAWRTDQ